MPNTNYSLNVVENEQTTSINVSVGRHTKQFTTAQKEDGWMVYAWVGADTKESEHPCPDMQSASELAWKMAIDWGRHTGQYPT